jgi:hypothetical protein
VVHNFFLAVLHRIYIYNAVPAARKWNTTIFDKTHTASPSGNQSSDDWLETRAGNEIGVSARLFSLAALGKPEFDVDLLAGVFAEVDVTLLGYRARLLSAQSMLSASKWLIGCTHLVLSKQGLRFVPYYYALMPPATWTSCRRCPTRW